MGLFTLQNLGGRQGICRFTSVPQNGICGMRLPLCRPTLTRFPCMQLIDECSINLDIR